MTETLTSIKIVATLVAVVNNFRALASQSSDSTVRARVSTFDSTIVFLLEFAVKEQIRRIDKAKETTARNKMLASKSALTDALVNAIATNDTKHVADLSKQIAALAKK